VNQANEDLSIYRDLIERGALLEEVLQALRRNGFSKVQSIKALVDLGQADIVQAKKIVHHSGTWGDVRVRDEAFVDELFNKYAK